MRRRYVQLFSQSLEKAFRGDCGRALVGGAGGLDQKCSSSWFRVFGLDLSVDTSLKSRDSLRAGRARFSTLVEEERNESRGYRREIEQAEIVRRFEKLLQKWSSNTPLLLDDLQVNSRYIVLSSRA